jgi:hypothetical protein
MKTSNYKYKQQNKRDEQKFGGLTAVSYREMECITLWACVCVCGNRRVVEENRLVSGVVTMCIPCELRSG